MILNKVDDIRKYWKSIKKDVEYLASKSSIGWIPEDLYCDIHENRAEMYLLFVDRYYKGFIVLQTFPDTLHVWGAYCNEHHRLEEGLKKVIEIAHERNLSKITFTSERKGWNKVARKIGFVPNNYVLHL